MLKALKRLWNDERGNALIIGGAALPILVGATGLATDTIQWSLWKRELQRAADSAAIAGVYDRVQAGNTSNTESAVNRDLELRGARLRIASRRPRKAWRIRPLGNLAGGLVDNLFAGTNPALGTVVNAAAGPSATSLRATRLKP